MIKKMLTLVFALVLVAVGFGCGGSGNTPPELQNVQPLSLDDPDLQSALEMERRGERVTGKDKAILDEAREAGLIPEAE